MQKRSMQLKQCLIMNFKTKFGIFALLITVTVITYKVLSPNDRLSTNGNPNAFTLRLINGNSHLEESDHLPGSASTQTVSLTPELIRENYEEFHNKSSNSLDHKQAIIIPKKAVLPKDFRTSVGEVGGKNLEELKITTREIPSARNFVFVDISGINLLNEKLLLLNEALNKTRYDIMKFRSQADWVNYNGSTDVVWLNKDNSMFNLSKYEAIVTLVLPWSQGEQLPRPAVFDWTGSEQLCEWIREPGLTKARWDAVFNRTCNTNISLALQPRYMEPVYFHGKPINPRDYWPNSGLFYPEHFYTEAPDHLEYIHVLQDGVVMTTGDVYSHNLKLVPYACSQDINPNKPENFDTYPIYSEVFVITQHWGASYFHMMLEVLPRIVPYLQFLKMNHQISVLVPSLGGYMAASLKLIGIGAERLITGNIRSKIVYVPRATPCGFPRPLELQMLSNIYQNNVLVGERNLVILIRRSGQRRFLAQMDVEESVKRTAEEYGLEYYLFRDDPTPGFDTTRLQFSRALFVIAPHGAGLSNIMYSQPETYVIEAVCNPPHVNMCYQWTAHILGQHYHGIASRGGCEEYIDVEPAMVEWVFRQYLTSNMVK